LAQLVQRSKDRMRTRERRRWLVLSVISLAAIGFLGLALWALSQRSEAMNQTKLADAAKTRADEAARLAQLERDGARMQLIMMQARQGATGATSSGDIKRASTLALQNIEIARSANRSTAAHPNEPGGNPLIRRPLLIFAHSKIVQSIAVLADGRLAT